ncbi:hypothetical protein FPV67DRAFT_1628954 [Lyophyllum atratum]|nr:hypothetical protein FPV67DRAFT_1628954 [Lyophyllum atratum]
MTPLATSPCEAHEGITGISLEILVHIQSYMEAFDIISLRQTCRYLYDATHQRTVWKSAFHRVCASHGLFKPSFPVEEMSTKALENAALGPRRFSSMLINKSLDSLPNPHTTRIVESRFAMPEEFGYFQTFEFIPGGRYLITTCDHAILLWDLGANINAQRTIRPNPIASLPVDNVVNTGCGPTTDGLGILLFVTKWSTPNQPFIDMSVHVIHPSSSTPKFAHVASLNNLHFVRLAWAWTDSLLVFSTRSSDVITVWNFNDNSIVSWDPQTPDILNIAISEGQVLVYRQHGFSLYTIPPLHPRPRTDNIDASVTNEPHPSVAEFAYNKTGAPQYMGCHPMSNQWMSGRADRQILGFVATDNELRRITNYYIWEKLNNPNLPTKIPLLADSSCSTDVPESYEFPMMPFCDQYITQILSMDNQLSLTLSPIPTETVATRGHCGTFKVTRLWETGWHDSGDILDYVLCPATGRLCVLTNDSAFLVIDYLAPY